MLDVYRVEAPVLGSGGGEKLNLCRGGDNISLFYLFSIVMLGRTIVTVMGLG